MLAGWCTGARCVRPNCRAGLGRAQDFVVRSGPGSAFRVECLPCGVYRAGDPHTAKLDCHMCEVGSCDTSYVGKES